MRRQRVRNKHNLTMQMIRQLKIGDESKIGEPLFSRNIALMKYYGAKTTLEEVVKIVQGNKIHKCPKCGGTGKVIKKRNKAQYWECCEDWEYYEITCDLCNGEGYTKREYKPKMIQDGWE